MSPAVDPSSEYTYLGTLDDMVAKYPWGYSINFRFLNTTLASSALFGNKVILPDGYLMNLIVARKALMRPELSPLLDLIHNGQVVVVSRLDDLSKIPEEMKKKGVASFPDLLDSSDWLKLKDILKGLTRRLSDRNLIWKWPKQDMGSGFRSTILRAQNKTVSGLGLNFVSQDILDRTFDVFQEMMLHNTYAARTRWENAVKMVSEKYLHSKREINRAKHELMFLGNEAYHYNFCGCLSATLRKPISVETRFSPAFADLLNVSESIDNYLERFYPKLLPRGFPLRDGKLLSEVIIPGTPLYDAKKQYLESLSYYQEKQLDYGQVESDANHYSRLLSQHFFGSSISSIWKLGISGAANLLLPLADPVLGQFSLAARIGITALIWTMDQYIPSYIVGLFKIADNVPDQKFFKSRKEWILTANPNQKRRFNKMISLNISKKSLRNFFQKIPKFVDDK